MESTKPDIAHQQWAIDQRAKVAHTLLTLYDYLETHDTNKEPWPATSFVDDLISAAFSLWRAVFLANCTRNLESIQGAQRKFLNKLVTTNAIAFGDDYENRKWVFGYYMLNAWNRLKTARDTARASIEEAEHDTLEHCFRIHAVGGPVENRYQWESLHAALRLLFLHLDKAIPIAIELPKPIKGHPFYG